SPCFLPFEDDFWHLWHLPARCHKGCQYSNSRSQKGVRPSRPFVSSPLPSFPPHQQKEPVTAPCRKRQAATGSSRYLFTLRLFGDLGSSCSLAENDTEHNPSFVILSISCKPLSGQGLRLECGDSSPLLDFQN